MLGYTRKGLLKAAVLAKRQAEKGASAVEYGLMVAAIAAVIVGTVFALGGVVKGAFDKTCTALNQPNSGITCTTAP